VFEIFFGGVAAAHLDDLGERQQREAAEIALRSLHHETESGPPDLHGADQVAAGDRVGGIPDKSLAQAFGALSGCSRASTGAGWRSRVA
jgi:electron transfer flavoprotein alpha subunit